MLGVQKCIKHPEISYTEHFSVCVMDSKVTRMNRYLKIKDPNNITHGT